MKTKIFNCLIVAFCAVLFGACHPIEPEYRHTDGPLMLIGGSITNEEGQPVDSIYVSVDTAACDFSYDVWWREQWWNVSLWNKPLGNDEPTWDIANRKDYSDKDGKYGLLYIFHLGIKLPYNEWPTELTLIATDSTGVYETQSQTFPVDVHLYYPDDSTEVYGIVKADFVMKKK